MKRGLGDGARGLILLYMLGFSSAMGCEWWIVDGGWMDGDDDDDADADGWMDKMGGR